MLALDTSLHGLAEMQAQLPAADSVLVGFGALAVVTLDEMWRVAQHVNIIAHEGAHALVGSSLVGKVASVALHRNATGLTKVRSASGRDSIVFQFAGYVGPSGFGLVAAKLISAGRIAAVLWLAVALLAILLSVVSTWFGGVLVTVCGGLLFVVADGGSAGLVTIVAYGLTWFLLLSGVRVVINHGSSGKDAESLRKLTYIPRTVWAWLWLMGTVVALAIGGSWLT